MFRDEGRTFLQWLGEPDLRHKMQGRLIVVHLVCRDMTFSLNATRRDHMMPLKNIFAPCVAFRVNGSPVKYTPNVSEVLFQSEATSTLASTSDGMSTKEYLVIGICTLLLGLIYVASVLLYLHMKKRKRRDQSPHMRNSLDDIANEINYPKNDQVTFGAPFTRSGSIYSAASLGTSNEPRSRGSIGSLKEEMGIIKSNPLLQHFPQLGEYNSGFTSDVSNSNSDCEMDGSFHDKLKQMQTSALVHPQMGMNNSHNNHKMHNNSPNDSPKSANNQSNAEQSHDGLSSASSTQETECLPVENVSIVEDMMTEEKLEHLRQMVNGNVRKKLYFNPAYFEPHLLAQPPPAALEFLHKIREVIAIAKYKMATKRYQPSLIMIPEEGTLRSDTPSIYSSNRQQTPSECQGCANNRCSGHVKNCGDKRNSIEKWLQTVTSNEEVGGNNERQHSSGGTNEQQEQTNKQQQYQQQQSKQQTNANGNSRRQTARSNSPPSHNNNRAHSHGAQRSPLRKEVTPPKQRPPPPPTPTGGSGSTQRNMSTVRSSAHDASSSSIEVKPSTSSVSYQLYCTSITTGPSVTIQVQRNYSKVVSALSAAATLYGFAETGSEIYNDPKFSFHDSPPLSTRSRDTAVQRGKSFSARKRNEIVDASSDYNMYGSATQQQQYNVVRHVNKLPESMYDALNRELNATYTGSNSFNFDIPTPDYDSTIEKKAKDIYNNTQSSGPSVPTPDYSTLSRKSLKQIQPDSPIYRRKSPQYLIVDYETDSLERLEATKRKSSHSSSSPSSDVSSQLSPSLSTALPLEEELEISHTVFDKSNGFRPDIDLKKKELHKSDSNGSKQKEIAARIKYDTPFLGSMTIEVEHELQSDIERSTDSDQFEPDTLDRKPKKQSFCDVNAWTAQALKNVSNGELSKVHASQDESELQQSGSYAQLNICQPAFMLRASNSFRSQSSQSSSCARQPNERHPEMHDPVDVATNDDRRPNFSTLREINQSPLVRQNSQNSCKCGGQHAIPKEFELDSEQGRLLTLEAKQKRRQQIVASPVPPPPPPVSVEISNHKPNKTTTIKISTPKGRPTAEAAMINPQVHNGRHSPSPTLPPKKRAASPKIGKELTKNVKAPHTPTLAPPQRTSSNTPNSTLNSTINTKVSSSTVGRKKRANRSPPPPPPSSASTTLTSQRSHASTQHSQHSHQHHYQNHSRHHHHFVHHTTTTATEDETASNHSESTEFTGVSDNFGNSEFGGSCNNTLNSVIHEEQDSKHEPQAVDNNSVRSVSSNSAHKNIGKECDNVTSAKQLDSPPSKLKSPHTETDYGDMFNTHISGLRNDYSLTKYMNRRKSQENGEEEAKSSSNDIEAQLEANNNINNSKNTDADSSKLDLLSIGSRSNRSSSRLSDRTKDMYRNAGVPVGIAYPQRSTASSNNSANSTPPPPAPAPTPTNSIQTVYHCEIEPVQLTHGMQIAMGLKDRAKKAKDLKNAWKKFVSMAASKFSPTHSPAPCYNEKKPPTSFLEVLDRDEGISSLIDDNARVSTPKSSYSAPASQNYYEQRFGPRPQEMDSGYMSADSAEVYKRSFYDRYNFKKMSGRDRIIRVDTIEDNSDGGSTLTDRHNGVAASARRGCILDSNRFEDLEHMGEPPANEVAATRRADSQEALEIESSDAESDKTLTQSSGEHGRARSEDAVNAYSSEEEDQQRRGQSPSYGSSETDGETNAEDMWESGAESIETHSVLYKNVRKS
ncbi:serine-rich adhesin for platelets isoform X2 [Eurosta solidaginis]